MRIGTWNLESKGFSDCRALLEGQKRPVLDVDRKEVLAMGLVATSEVGAT